MQLHGVVEQLEAKPEIPASWSLSAAKNGAQHLIADASETGDARANLRSILFAKIFTHKIKKSPKRTTHSMPSPCYSCGGGQRSGSVTRRAARKARKIKRKLQTGHSACAEAASSRFSQKEVVIPVLVTIPAQLALRRNRLVDPW